MTRHYGNIHDKKLGKTKQVSPNNESEWNLI